MGTVSYFHINALLEGLAYAEARRGRPLDIHPDDESSMKEAYAAHVVPNFARLSIEGKELVKRSLAYFLKKRGDHWHQVLANEQDLTLPEPTDVRSMFCWLWEVLFPREDFRQIETDEFAENNDPLEINKLYAGHGHD
jgi:hypothetical protein